MRRRCEGHRMQRPAAAGRRSCIRCAAHLRHHPFLLSEGELGLASPGGGRRKTRSGSDQSRSRVAMSDDRSALVQNMTVQNVTVQRAGRGDGVSGAGPAAAPIQTGRDSDQCARRELPAARSAASGRRRPGERAKVCDPGHCTSPRQVPRGRRRRAKLTRVNAGPGPAEHSLFVGMGQISVLGGGSVLRASRHQPASITWITRKVIF